MTHEAFDQLVSRIEKRFAQKPAALRNRVLFWAALGFSCFFAWFAGVVILSLLLIVPGCLLFPDAWIMIVAGGCIFIFGCKTFITSLHISVEPPKGRQLTRNEVPALFDCLDELQQACRARSFDAVYLTTEFNAGVIEEPRLGALGWWKKTLVIGLPLLELLSVDELRAVLAHEFAHLSAGHARSSHWIYRLRRAWENLFSKYLNRPLQKSRLSIRGNLRRFLHWFWPRFNAHAFVLSRACEYDADALAARVTSPLHIANALARIRTCGQIIGEKFWSEIWLLARKNQQPPSDIFDQLPAFVLSTPSEKLQESYCTALKVVSTNADTHPCLTERLRAIYPQNDFQPVITKASSAAHALLGSVEPQLRRELNNLWTAEAAEEWKRNFDRAISLEHRLQSMPTQTADAEALWDKARAAMDLSGDAAAEPLLREALALDPAHINSNYQLGRILLHRNDPGGEALLERAITADHEALVPACEVLFDYARRKGDEARLQAIRRRLDEHNQMLVASEREIREVTPGDTFIPHELSPDQLEPVRTFLRTRCGIVNAWLARKKLQHCKRQQLFLLTLELHRPWHGIRNTDTESLLFSEISAHLKLPGRVLVLSTSGHMKAVAQKVRNCTSAAI
jgi:Zn-dependent protease with chaperone function